MKLRPKTRLIALPIAMAIALSTPGLSAPAVVAAPAIERTVLFADFEEGTDWQLGYRVLSQGKGSVSTGDLETPPIPMSKRYLYISFRATMPTGLRIRPPEAIRFEGYVRRFEFWAMGTGNADELSLDLIDATGQNHRVSAGRLDFIGWRKLRVVPTPRVRQRNPNGRTGIQFRGLYLSPAGRMADSGFSLFSLRVYVDHFMAITRDHLRQPSDRWGRLNL